MRFKGPGAGWEGGGGGGRVQVGVELMHLCPKVHQPILAGDTSSSPTSQPTLPHLLLLFGLHGTWLKRAEC